MRASPTLFTLIPLQKSSLSFFSRTISLSPSAQRCLCLIKQTKSVKGVSKIGPWKHFRKLACTSNSIVSPSAVGLTPVCHWWASIGVEDIFQIIVKVRRIARTVILTIFIGISTMRKIEWKGNQSIMLHQSSPPPVPPQPSQWLIPLHKQDTRPGHRQRRDEFPLRMGGIPRMDIIWSTFLIDKYKDMCLKFFFFLWCLNLNETYRMATSLEQHSLTHARVISTEAAVIAQLLIVGERAGDVHAAK